MIPEVANPHLKGVLEISEEIVRFSKAGGRSHFYFNTEQNFADVVCCHIEKSPCAVVPETDFEREKRFGFYYMAARNARRSVTIKSKF